MSSIQQVFLNTHTKILQHILSEGALSRTGLHADTAMRTVSQEWKAQNVQVQLQPFVSASTGGVENHSLADDHLYIV